MGVKNFFKDIGKKSLKKIFYKVDIRRTEKSKIQKSLITFLIIDILFFTIVARFVSHKMLVLYTILRLTGLLTHYFIFTWCLAAYFVKFFKKRLLAIEDDYYEEEETTYYGFSKSFISLILLVFELNIFSSIILPQFTKFRNTLYDSNAINILIGLLCIECIIDVLRLYIKRRVDGLKF